MMLLQEADIFLRRTTAFRSGAIPNNKNHCCQIGDIPNHVSVIKK
jgi:hypothetical protein